jgi:hypothetical protein
VRPTTGSTFSGGDWTALRLDSGDVKTPPRIIGLTGYARSGKDEFATALEECGGYEIRSFSAPLKAMLLALDPIFAHSLDDVEMHLAEYVEWVGWEQVKDQFPEVRRLLQALGTEAGRGILGEDVWVNAAMKAVAPAAAVVFKDCRFPNEARAITDRGGIIVRIEREGVGPCNDHPSETAMDDYEWDYVIRNDGTVSELRRKAMDLVAKESGTFDWGSVGGFASVPSYDDIFKNTMKTYGPKAVNGFRADGPWATDRLAQQAYDAKAKNTPTIYQGTEL